MVGNDYVCNENKELLKSMRIKNQTMYKAIRNKALKRLVIMMIVKHLICFLDRKVKCYYSKFRVMTKFHRLWL